MSNDYDNPVCDDCDYPCKPEEINADGVCNDCALEREEVENGDGDYD